MTFPDSAGLETPEADAVEQSTDAYPGENLDTSDTEPVLDDEAPDWDARQQREFVGPEDEYR